MRHLLNNSGIRQFIKFGIVGGICFIIDSSILHILAKHMHYLFATIISYIISTIVNYVLSMTFVFVSKTDSKIKELILFIFPSLIGLLLTEIGMYLLTEQIKFHYMISKMWCVGIVMIFNFVTRKLLLEKTGKGNQ